MQATPAGPDAAPAHPTASIASPSGPAVNAAASTAHAAAACPQSLLTPAVTRVIAWHQQRNGFLADKTAAE